MEERYAIFCKSCLKWVTLCDLLENSDIDVPPTLKNTIPIFPKMAYAISAMKRARLNNTSHGDDLQIITMGSGE